MYYVLYNPLSGNGQGKTRAEELKTLITDGEVQFRDIREIKDYRELFGALLPEDRVVIAGGDGTLNRFINFTDGINIENELLYFAVGSGNDFRHDVAPDSTGLIRINEYIKNLPYVTVNGKTHRFLNGIGYGIDGYCCEVGDKVSQKSDKPVNYAGIAIKGLLFHYHPTNAKVTVDGKTYEFRHVWLAPAMNGKYYGGGMKIAPDQERLNPQKTVSVVLLYGSGKLKTLVVFPSIFKGEHVRHEEMVSVLTGHEITVEFDRPTALQIDGETVLGVTSYTVSADRTASSDPDTKKEAAVC